MHRSYRCVSIDFSMPTDTYDVNLTGLSWITGQKHGTFTVGETLRFVEDNRQEIFNLSPAQIIEIKDGLSQVIIKTQDKKYYLNFNNPRKQARRGLFFGAGILFGAIGMSTGKKVLFNSDVQATCKQAITSLISHGYNTSLNKHRPA